MSDLSVWKRRFYCISKPLANDGNSMTPASKGVGVVGGNAAAASSGTILKGGKIHVYWFKRLLPVRHWRLGTWVCRLIATCGFQLVIFLIKILLYLLPC